MNKPFKPDLSCKITIRCSKKDKETVAGICRRSNIAEAEALRYLLSAGILIAKKKGIGYVIDLESNLGFLTDKK